MVIPNAWNLRKAITPYITNPFFIRNVLKSSNLMDKEENDDENNLVPIFLKVEKIFKRGKIQKINKFQRGSLKKNLMGKKRGAHFSMR